MLTCRLQGGLGNQMFQIAATYGIAKKQNLEAKFNLDYCHTPAQGNEANKYDKTFFKLLPRFEGQGGITNVINEMGFSYNKITPKDNSILNGYFQSDKYFKEYKNDLRNRIFYIDEVKMEEFDEYIDGIVGEEDITAVHVRRGDYMNLTDFHAPCSVEYYKEATERIGGNFIFVSDDIEWCKENFKGDNIYFSPYTEELDDLYLIMACNNQIIANSSFSWWGAYLSDWDGTVIAPKKWFGPKGPQDTQDLIPNNWIKI